MKTGTHVESPARSAPATRPFGRRDFLVGAGGFVTAAALLKACSTTGHGRFAHSHHRDPLAAARAAGLRDPILLVLGAGISAPNPHNSQAWKFRIESSTEALLYVDETRILPMTDPTTRQIHIGQGCLLALVEAAAGELGLEARTFLFPEGYRLPVDLGKKPVARIELLPSKKRDPLAQQIAGRFTSRTEYGGPAITGEEFAQLIERTKPKTEVRFTPAHELEKHVTMHMRGFKLEVEERRTAEESRHWFRIGDREIYGKRDGISLPSNGITGFQKWFIESFVLSHDPKDYYNPDGQKTFLERYSKNLFTARGQALFVTQTNEPADWIAVGQDYVRFQLAAHSLGLVMRPTSQLMQEFPEMSALAREYNELCGVRAPAKIQMNALLGRAEPVFISPRRALTDMLRPG